MKIKTAIFAALMVSSMALVGCQQGGSGSGGGSLSMSGRAERELPAKIQQKMAAMGMPKTSPIIIRVFKEESALEVWKQKSNGQYGLIATYEICQWSGKLGPKFIEGDRQAPEGFYTVRPTQMNPNSNYYLAFNIGFPNAYDAVNGRTGRHLMVHGACSSSGCYSMTDESIAEIYAFGRDSFRGGQHEFQVQAFPFRMTAANMARYRNDANYAFWRMLKEGYDIFEATKKPPQVDVCEKRYVFNRRSTSGQPLSPAGACPAPTQSLPVAYAAYQAEYNSAFSEAINKKSKKPASPSIAGLEEARLVADWSARRARGEKVSRTPPSLSSASTERSGAPDIAPASANQASKNTTLPTNASAPAAKPTTEQTQQSSAVQNSSDQQTAALVPVQENKKKSWLGFLSR